MLSKSVTKYIQSLQQKKFRDIHNSFVAEGPKIAAEFLAEGYFECEYFFCTTAAAALLPQKDLNKLGQVLVYVEEHELKKISGLNTANAVLAVFKKKQPVSYPVFANKISLVLDDVQDPGNLGTIIRNADWFGIENIVCSLNCADAYNPKVVQSTMASLGRVNILYTDLKIFFEKNNAILKFATVLGGKDLSTFNKIKEGFIVIGNEARGVSEQLKSVCDEQVTIVKKGRAESLNAGVAAGIVLYALA